MRQFKLSMRKKLFKAFIVIALISFLTVWLISFIDINRKFPKAQLVEYSEKDSYKENDIEYKVVNSTIFKGYEETIKKFSDTQVLEAMSRGEKNNYAYLYTELEVNNFGDSDVNVWVLAQSFLAESFPSAWSNAPFVECDKTIIKNGEKAIIKMAFILNIPMNRNYNNEKFYLVHRTYPDKVVILLDIRGE